MQGRKNKSFSVIIFMERLFLSQEASLSAFGDDTEKAASGFYKKRVVIRRRDYEEIQKDFYDAGGRCGHGGVSDEGSG